MFKQKIEIGYQVETPDNWLKEGNPFELRREEYAKEVRFGGNIRVEYDDSTNRTKFVQENYESVLAIPYDMPIVGYGNHHVNTLRIWDAKAITDFQLDSFDRGDYHKAVEQENLAKTIVEVLYPNDNHYAGKELRLKQQYFFISASIQAAITKYKKTHDDIHKLPEKVIFQMNDTHPTVAVAELMRILLDEEELGWNEAWDITTKTCAYTNHTIMAEALEKWPIDLFSRLLPRVYQIIQEIDRRFLIQVRERYPGNEEKVRKMAILYNGQVRMAHLAIVAGFSVNGVARLHTEILKNQELRDFYEMMPEKFNNKTNGITQRRFLMHGNPLLVDWVTEKIGTKGWITDLSLMSGLKKYADDSKALAEFMDIKYKNKVRLAEYIRKHNGIEVDPRSIFDVQVKRLHEYKRQLLNILHVMYLYNQIKEHPEMSFFPPALEIADLTVQPPNASEPLAFRNVRAGLTVFPLGISLDADIAGGELNATVIPSSLWNPERLAVRSSLSGVGIEPLLRPFMGKTSLVQIRSGKLAGSATLDLPLLNGRPEPLAGEGSLNLSMCGGVADLSLPMLKGSRLDKLEGAVETDWKKERLTLHQLAVRSPMLACTVQGQVTLVPRDLPASRMDVQSALRIPLEQVREELMPERTLQSLKDKGEVRVRIRDTFRRPSFDVQP